MATRASTHQKRLASTHNSASTGTHHLQVWRVLTKQLGKCRRVWRVLQNGSGNFSESGESRLFLKTAVLASASNSLNSLVSSHCLIPTLKPRHVFDPLSHPWILNLNCNLIFKLILTHFLEKSAENNWSVLVEWNQIKICIVHKGQKRKDNLFIIPNFLTLFFDLIYSWFELILINFCIYLFFL